MGELDEVDLLRAGELSNSILSMASLSGTPSWSKKTTIVLILSFSVNLKNQRKTVLGDLNNHSRRDYDHLCDMTSISNDWDLRNVAKLVREGPNNSKVRNLFFNILTCI